MTEQRALAPEDPVTFGDYRTVSVLGQGGQGVVYLAIGPSGSRVAVKVLHAHLVGDERARRRFLREVEAAGAVEEFCTARVLEVGLAGTRPYVVSEYVDGESLHELVRRDGPRDAGALHRLAIGTAAALAAVHRAGIVHRDFKPTNVLLSIDGPRVIDFGIARALDGTATMTSGVVGTPAYLSPEQISGEPAGPATDVFSWALTMVYAATGRPAFGSGSVPSVMNRILHHDPDLSALPEPLRGVVARCLAKQPGQRPSAAQLIEDLTGQGHRPQPVQADPAPVGPTLIDAAAPARHAVLEASPHDRLLADATPGAEPPPEPPPGRSAPSHPVRGGAATLLRLCLLSGVLANGLIVFDWIILGTLILNPLYVYFDAAWWLALLPVTVAAWRVHRTITPVPALITLITGVAAAVLISIAIIASAIFGPGADIRSAFEISAFARLIWLILLAVLFWRRSKAVSVFGVFAGVFGLLLRVAGTSELFTEDRVLDYIGVVYKVSTEEIAAMWRHLPLVLAIWLAWLALDFRHLFSAANDRTRPGAVMGGGSARPAGWAARAGAAVIDGLLAGSSMIIAVDAAISTISDISVGYTADLDRLILNVVCGAFLLLLVSVLLRVQEGTIGQTPGKRVMGIWLVKEETGGYVGAATALGRGFCHIVDALPLCIGFLFPIWDAKGQTFADKITRTQVVKA